MQSLRALVPETWKHPSLKRNVIMNWVSTVANVGLSFLLIPLVVRTLDKELYGVWSFLNGLAAYSNLIYMGLGAAFMKYFSEAKGREDTPEITRLLGIACTLYLFLGGLCLLMSLILSPFVPDLFATPLPTVAAQSAKITTVLLGARLQGFFVASAFSALLAAHGRMDLIAAVSTLSACLRTLAAVLALRFPDPLVALATVMVLEALWQLAALVGLSRLVAPSIRVAPTTPRRDELSSLYGFGFQAFFVQLAVLLISYTDTALIGMLLGAASVTLYSLPLQLVEYSRVLVNGVTLALLPELSASRVRGDTARMKEVYLRAARACGALAAFVNIHLVILGPAFLGLWVGKEFVETSKPILFFLGISAVASALSTQVLSPFYQAMDILGTLVAIVVAEAVANVVLSVWLAQRLGLAGVALATAVPACAITLLLTPRHLLPQIGVRRHEFISGIAVPVLSIAVVVVSIQGLLSNWIGLDSYATLVTRAGCSAVGVVPVVVAIFPRNDWMPLVSRWVR